MKLKKLHKLGQSLNRHRASAQGVPHYAGAHFDRLHEGRLQLLSIGFLLLEAVGGVGS